MADLKISELSALAGSNLVAADALAIVDDSASETKKITVSDLIANGVTVISDDTIPGAKILFGAGDIATAALADGAVTAAKVADDAITAAKLGNESTVDLVTTLPGAGAFTGQLAFDTDDNKLYVWDGSAWKSLKAAGSVNTVSGSTTGEINIVSSVSGDTVTLTATIDNTSSANQFLAGPTGAAGAVGYRVIDGSDLPVSTSSAKGGVIVNGEGLRMDANTIEVNNDVTASSTHHVVTYDAKGLITGGRVLAASDLPIATASAVGGVIASTGLTVDGSGNLTINNTVTADTYTKVTVAATGLVTAGSNLAASDLPNHSADLLTSGNIPLARIADNLITGAKLADYASAKIGETNPTADYIGQLFFNPLTRDLSLWDGNVFQPIGISAGEIVFAGTYNATTNLVSSVTSDGTGAGFVVGQALPAASGTNKNFYVVVGVGGTGTSPAPAVSLAPPDFILSTGSEYRLIDVSETVTAQVASNVGFTPVGTIAANNVQTALAEVDTEKLAKSGGTMTGNLELNDANVVFEGSTENAFETTLTVVDPTADRTIVFPNVSGNVVTTGDTGTVTSAMIADATIANADINASAEIAVSKLANGTARQLLQTASNGSDVEFTSNVDVPGTLDITGAATLDSTLGVTGLISANGKVSFPLGSAAAPSLLPGADTNTGIFSPGADQLAITTGGTQRVTVDSAGRVLVGTTTEGYVDADDLTIANSGHCGMTIRSGASNQARILFSDATSGIGEYSGYILFDHPTNALSIGTSSTDALQIDSSGRVGIGNTVMSSFTANSSDNLVVGDGSGSEGITVYSAAQGSVSFADGTSGNAAYRGAIEYNHTVDQLAFRTAGTGNRMLIDSSGRVGIGQSSPTTKLEVAGDVKVVNTGIAYLQPNTVTAFQAYESSGSAKISLNNNGSATFGGVCKVDRTVSGDGCFHAALNGTVNASITSAGSATFVGDVGVGLTSPQTRLHISGTTNGAQATFGASSSGLKISTFQKTGNDAGVILDAQESTNGTLAFNTRGSERMRIDSSGNVLVGLTTAVGIGGTPADLNSVEIGRGFLNISRDDTAAADHILFGKNGSIASSIGTSTTNSLVFKTGTAERMRVLSSGGLTFNGDTAQANALDDYEEGTYTPTIQNFSTTGTNTLTGRYVKVGRQVTVGIQWNCTGTITHGVSALVTLPFSPTAGTGANGLIGMLVNSNQSAFNSNKTGVQCKIDTEGAARFFPGSFTATSTGEGLLFGGTYIASA